MKSYDGGYTVAQLIKVKERKVANQINTAAELDAEIKLLQMKLASIKDELGGVDPGKYVTSDGHTVTISESPKFSEITPDAAKKALREKRQGKNFMECIKVAVTPLKRYLSDQEIGTLREVTTYTRRYSFK